MKKILLSFAAFLLVAFAVFAGGNTVVSWTGAADWTVSTAKDTLTFAQDPYTIVLSKVGAQNAPTVNATQGDARVYAKGQICVSTTGENMTTIVFNVSNNGHKRLAEISADNGEVVVDNTKWTVTWTGNAQSVVFTVGEKATYGTESTKAGQLCFDNVEIYTAGDVPGTGEGGGETPGDSTVTDTPADTTATDEVPVLWSEDFNGTQGEFTIENKVLPEGLSYIWKADSHGYMKASAYANKANHAAESWLVSPEIDLTAATDCALSFEQAGNFFGSQESMQAMVSVKVKAVDAAEWSALELNEWPAGTNWTFATSTADLKAFEGKKIQVAFVYTSTEETAGTWEVKNVQVKGNGEVVVPEPEIPSYTSVADMQAAATSSKVDVTYEFSDLLVTGVGVRGGKASVYVNDGNSFLFYGGTTTFKKGDRISGKLAGQLALYNNAAQLTVTSYEGITVASSDNAVEPAVVTIADLGNDAAFAYQNKYVQLQNVFFETDTLNNSNINVLDDSDNTITLRDNFSVLGDVVFDPSKTYNVSGYVAYYKGVAQLYPCEAADVEMVTNLKNAETAWAADTVVVLPGDAQQVNNALSTLSDGEKTFASSNASVATVDAEGNISLVGTGHTVISVTTAETATYLESRASFDLFVIEGTGEVDKAFTAADVQYYNGRISEKVWVKGAILGSMNGNAIYEAADTANAVASNIVIGTADCYVPVQLPSKSDVRAALNLLDNPSLQGANVWVYGNITSYFSMPGVKNTSDWSLDGTTGLIVVEQPATGEKTIYSLDGRRLTKLQKGINIVNGKKVIVK